MPEHSSRDLELTADQAPPAETLTRVGTDELTPPAGELPAGDLPAVPGYAVTHEIARGGVGRVLAGTELALDREVAIKVLLPGANAARFVSESKITARLPHPNIPPVYALGTLADGSSFLAMKLVRGRTLAAELRARAAAGDDLPRLVQVIEQVCQAVGFAHSQHVVHRDIKPANVMLGAFGEVQVMDWGLAKEMRNAEPGMRNQDQIGEATVDLVSGSDSAFRNPNSEFTKTGAVLGTPAYMAPEQARGEDVDERADVFALGGLLCTVLTGHVVHTGQTVSEMVRNAATGRLADALARLDTCGADAELVQIARRCLAADRADRPADGKAVAEAIAAYRHGVETRLHRAETDRAAAEVREAEERKRRRLFLRLGGAAAAVLVLGIVGTAVGLMRANRAATAERAAKEKAETRLGLVRDTIRQFTNDLPAIGGGLPLSAPLREELLALSKRLVTSIRDEGDLNDTYDLGEQILLLREARDADDRGDLVVARAKAAAARDGFQRILDSNPQQFRDRARNNVGIALTQLGRIDVQDKKYDDAEANYRRAIDLRKQILADPNGDLPTPEVEVNLAITYRQSGHTELTRDRNSAAEPWFRLAAELCEKCVRTSTDPQTRETARLNWAQAQAGLASLAYRLKDRAKVVEIYTGIVRQLEADLKASPSSGPLRFALANNARYLGEYVVDDRPLADLSREMVTLGIRHRRWFWSGSGSEVPELARAIGSGYYMLGCLADHDGKPELAKKYFRLCLPLWEIGVDDLEERGEPADSSRMISRRIGRMLARGRCGMHAEAGREAAEIQELATRPALPLGDRTRCAWQAGTGFGLCAVAFPSGSPDRVEFWRKAMAALTLAVQLGYDDWHWMATDADFDCLRECPEFVAFLAEKQGKKPPK